MVLTCDNQHCEIIPGLISGDGTSCRLFLVGRSKQYSFSLFPLVCNRNTSRPVLGTAYPSRIHPQHWATKSHLPPPLLASETRTDLYIQYIQGLRGEHGSGLHTVMAQRQGLSPTKVGGTCWHDHVLCVGPRVLCFRCKRPWERYWAKVCSSWGVCVQLAQHGETSSAWGRYAAVDSWTTSWFWVRTWSLHTDKEVVWQTIQISSHKCFNGSVLGVPAKTSWTQPSVWYYHFQKIPCIEESCGGSAQTTREFIFQSQSPSHQQPI